MEEPLEPLLYDDSVSEAHIEPETLLDFVRGTLTADQTHEVTDHLAFCARCRNAFAEAIRSIEVSPSSGTQSRSHSTTDETFPNFSGYRQVERLAQGGMGTIYLAKKNGTQQQVAIKRILLRDREVVGSDRKQRL